MLGILPLRLDRMAVELVFLVKVFKASKHIVDDIQFSAVQRQGHLCRDQKFQVSFKEGIDVVFTVKPSIHDQFHFGKAQHVQVRQQVLDGLGVRDVASQLAVIERKVGFPKM